MITVIADGVETELSTLAALVAHDGWGTAPAHILSRRGPLQHGESYDGYRLDARQGELVFRLKETDLDAMYVVRQTLIDLFAPQRELILRFNLTYGVRQIRCYALPSSMAWTVDDWAAQKLAVSLYCPDPAFYDPAGWAVTVDLGGGGVSFEVPTAVPTGVGASIINQSHTITYTGNWLEYPQIRVTGPITDCVVTQNTTGEVLDFIGTTIAAGDYYDIDLRYGLKTVTDAAGANKVARLTAASDLATWHIASAVEAPGGINTVVVTGSSVTTATSVSVTGFTRYLGI